MNQLFLGLITAAVIAAVIIFVYVMLDLRRMMRALERLAGTVENSLKPTIAELQETLRSVRNAADDFTTVSEDIRNFSGALRGIGENVRCLSGEMERLTKFVKDINSSVAVEASSLRVGLKAGLQAFLKNLFGLYSSRSKSS